MKQTIVLLISAALLALGCEKESEDPATPGLAHLMVYNGSADFYNAQGLVLKNNQPLGSRTYNDNGIGLVGAFNFASYSLIDSGSYRIAYLDSSSIPAEAAKLSETRVHLENGQHYTLYLLDSLGFFEILTTRDEVARDPAMANIRLVHLSPDAGEVYLRLDTALVADIKPLSFRGVSHFVKVGPDIKPAIRIMYKDKETGEERTLSRKSFPLQAGRCYTMILRGYRDPADGNVNKTINLSTITNY
ncbi:MAG: DUF4397 domain-containing protein [Candidatus Pseudobacter hemicellulosilyticus]|uniref:DUF4397 domain-containing protein n=1 Tax=Candidatus Pseudobacter hemicellulosilyticus TaxID=3121375 RepID=A0AAJ5WWH3_9BACT|nr:MAG: DUF4397 domain-containing protein [Pseudobacter sp.]